MSGFPYEDQWIDYENKELGGTGWTIGGVDGGVTGDAGCRYFKSQSLVGKDANGFSGGLVTSELYGNIQLEGVCMLGSGSEKALSNDFVRFISVEVLRTQFELAWEKFEDLSAQSPLVFLDDALSHQL